jgi:peptidoglycan/xylan/chitin deacetylase (PgdA/CDA1 family)
VASLTGLLRRSGVLVRHLRRQGGLRILTYHGVCADAVAAEPWLPPHFVTATQFAHQMQLLTELGTVVHLPEVVRQLAADEPFRRPSFAVTFDDGHACTLRQAAPALDQRGLHATFFVSTGHIDTGAWFVSDRLRVLQYAPKALTADLPAALRPYVEAPVRAKAVPADNVRDLLDAYWPTVVDRLGPGVREALHPASWDELLDLQRRGHDVGAHTVTHVILSRETRARREAEITDSIRRVRAQTGSCIGFAYPNGGPGDFDSTDIEILRREGIAYALTTTPGRCVPPLNLHRLPRTSIGLAHDPATFLLDMSGWLERRRRRQATGAWAR